MKASEAGLLSLLKKSPQFQIPIYQRTYSWTDRECRQLWDDIVRAGSTEDISVHFVGSVVYIETGLSLVTDQAPLLVIDGQQRLTTVTLLIAALAQALENVAEDHEPVDGFSPRKLRNYYLVNPEETGERHHKLLLTQTDKSTLNAIISGAPRPDDFSLRIDRNLGLFTEWLDSRRGDLAVICRGLSKLVVVDVALNRSQDNPQLIFESMNSTGRELTQADLIRNYVLMGLEPELQTRLYSDYWRPMEVAFGQEAYVTHFDAFMRHYLTVRMGEIPKIGEVYEAFKAYARRDSVATAGVEALVRDVRDFARHFCAMALGAESDSHLAAAFQDLRELKVDVAYPLLLELYDDYVHELLSKDDFVSAVRMIEAYVFRRAVCSIPTNTLNKTFATFSKSLKKDRYVESIAAAFLLMQSYRRFPRDDEFERDIQTRDLYNFRSRSYWLRKLENHGRKERVSVDEYTIEHILPQNPNLSSAWKADLGPEYERIQKEWLHTLGNLTLTGYNSEYSDKSFAAKRDMTGGFKESPLRVNQGLGQLEKWDESAIKKRARRLARTASEVWSHPSIDVDVLDAYKPQPESTGYGIEDHPHLAEGPVRELFEALRREVLALDPAVTEQFLKLYVAYKAESNFVDVIPQAKRLRLSLSIPIAEIVDPRGIARDVSSIGRWGTGDVEVYLSSMEELQYAMGLVRQALERQLGDGEVL